MAADRLWSLACPRSLIVHGDEDVIRAALDALVENAVRATGDGDAVTVLCHGRRESVVLGVGDGGPGVSQEDSSLVFQRFWRNREHHEGSTGLGLSFVRAAAEAHGGVATVGQSAHGGALVTFELRIGETLAPVVERPAELLLAADI